MWHYKILFWNKLNYISKNQRDYMVFLFFLLFLFYFLKKILKSQWKKGHFGHERKREQKNCRYLNVVIRSFSDESRHIKLLSDVNLSSHHPLSFSPILSTVHHRTISAHAHVYIYIYIQHAHSHTCIISSMWAAIFFTANLISVSTMVANAISSPQVRSIFFYFFLSLLFDL